MKPILIIAGEFSVIWIAAFFFHVAGPNPQTWIQGAGVASALFTILIGVTWGVFGFVKYLDDEVF